MADQLPMAYLISVDGVTIVNHSTLKAKTTAQDTAVVNIPMYVIPSQVKLYYNSTADATPVTPGQVTQEILCTTGGIALYNSLRAKEGHYVTSIASVHSGGANITCQETVIASVIDTTPGLKRDGDVHIRVVIDVVGDWT